MIAKNNSEMYHFLQAVCWKKWKSRKKTAAEASLPDIKGISTLLNSDCSFQKVY